MGYLFEPDRPSREAAHHVRRTPIHQCTTAMCQHRRKYVCGQFDPNSMLSLFTVGPLIIESFQAKKRVSTGALGALDDPLVVQTKN